jgi:hypothetical protein
MHEVRMKVLLETAGMQASVHRGIYTHTPAGRRLHSFVKFLETLGAKVEFTASETSLLSQDDFLGTALFVVTTRRPRLDARSETELELLDRFVRDGGGLLLMSNHPFPKKKNVLPDDLLAARFGVKFNAPIYPAPETAGGYTHISGEDILDHSITRGLSGPIVFNNCCRLSHSGGIALALLPGESKMPNVFAVANDDHGKGRVVVTADSGFIGEKDTIWPGPGLIAEGNNAEFIQRILRWLLRT